MPVVNKNKKKPVIVLCANCLREHEDLGIRATCKYCGVHPLPSYAYSKKSIFHPTNCRCVAKPIIIERRTKRSSLQTMLHRKNI